MTAPTIYAHGIGGGWDLRHAGCAPKCCEAEAHEVDAGLIKIGVFCGGCGQPVGGGLPPAPRDFDRDEPCETHA